MLPDRAWSANPGPAVGQRRRRPPVAAGQLSLVSDAAMLDAIRIARIGGLPAEMEIGLARMAHRPAADAVVKVEQRGLVGNLGRGLGRDQPARRRGRDRRLGIAWTLADEAARTDRAILNV